MDHHDHSSLKSSKCIPKDFKKRVEELCELRLKPRAIMQKLEAEGWDHLDHKKYLQVFLLQFRSMPFKITAFLFNLAAATQVCGIKKRFENARLPRRGATFADVLNWFEGIEVRCAFRRLSLVANALCAA